MNTDNACSSILRHKYDDGCFISKSKLTVNVFDDEWILLPNKGKGWKVKVGWLHASDMCKEDKILVFDVYVHYASRNAAGTCATLITNTKRFLQGGIPSLKELKAFWSNLKVGQKKSLNQFFRCLVQLGNKEFNKYHRYTKSRLDKKVNNHLDPNKGSFNNIEFDSLSREINYRIRDVDWDVARDIDYFTGSSFSKVRNIVSSKILLSLVRRPIQISNIKWCDLIPEGASYDDNKIDDNLISSIGANTLQLRIFLAKDDNLNGNRDVPESYPIHVSENLSEVIVKYKKLYTLGVRLMLDKSLLNISDKRLVKIIQNMPMFPSSDMFDQVFEKVSNIENIFSYESTAFHVSEGAIASAIRYIKPVSNRTSECIATSNRIRHTVLTRGARDGLSVNQLARMTGVTVPAVRHYIDLDYSSRKMIDEKYIGNEFLKRAFSTPVSIKDVDEEHIVDHNFNPVGVKRKLASCTKCSIKMGKPLGCYGCYNFLPILEADHRSELAIAENKKNFNEKGLLSPLKGNEVEKLEKQIFYIKCTIAICDDILSNKVLIDA